jgi:hypothetical protein
MVRYKYGKHTGTTVHGEALESAKREEIESNDGKLVAPVTRNVAQLAAMITVNPPLPKEGFAHYPPYGSFALARVRH